ncbi:right-handed parallel beta-helix repeat-containing protein, partial [bacterium]|nr:right-handed parallel beta-helix repeat-containing protein [bacterium]
KPMTLARWPNAGYVPMTGLPKGKMARVFNYDGDRPARWAAEPDLWVYGYWYHDWADNYMKVARVDTKARSIEIVNPHRYGFKKGNRWHVLNCLAELDSPGEYYVDRATGILTFWPPADLAAGRPMVSVAKNLVEMKETSYVTIQGFTLEACRGMAVNISGGSHNQLVGCTIRNIGNRGVLVTGADNAVIGCDITETGDGGIAMHGGDRKTLTPARLLAENNHIHAYSRWCHVYRAGVQVGGCGNIVRHNLIHNGHHNGIQLGGNDHVIELNEVHDVCYDTGDVGAFYMGRDWTSRGTVIRHNYWHDIQGPGHFGAMGVYLDDQASGIAITGNIFHKVTRAVFIGGGCDNVVENNVFVDCTPSAHIDARGLGWQKKATDDPKATLRSQLRAMPYKNALWAKRYPNLPNILNDDPGTPKRNRFVRNICVDGKWDHIDAKTRKYQTVENNLVGKDPKFVDRLAGDFRLKPDSPALAMGFKPIPIEKIGLYKDARRASWPVEHKPRPMPESEVIRRLKAQTQPAPVVAVPRQASNEDVKPVLLQEDFFGEKSTRTSTARIDHDGAHLIIIFVNTVAAKPALKTGHAWGVNDAVEIAVKNLDAGKGAPTLVLRGYVDGTFESVDDAGAPAAAVAKAKQGVEYKTEVSSPTKWGCEWRIPFASLGIDPEKHKRLAANFSVRKTADDLWLQWRSTRGNTHAVEKAGILELKK